MGGYRRESPDSEKNDMATTLLFQSIPEVLILQLGEISSAKQVWEAIKARHMGSDRVREARLQILVAEFYRLKMKETKTIDDFVGKLSEISSKAASLGDNIEESKLGKKFLKSLPRRKYIHIVASLEQVLDLKTTTFEDIIGRLKAYEERVTEEEEGQEDQTKLMYANPSISKIIPTTKTTATEVEDEGDDSTARGEVEDVTTTTMNVICPR